MSKELDYIADLERENRLLKSILYCTKRSCNNCGKVNCENFQRQRIDCCGLWVSYKDYIKQQEGQIADIKANCDYVLEGKDLEIKELKETDEYIIKTLESKVEKLKEDLRNKRISIKNKKAEINELKLELTVEKDQHQEEINLHLHAEDYIKSLEKENKKVKQGCHRWFMRWRKVKREELEEISKIEELEKENDKLKDLVDMYNYFYSQAKELLAKWVELFKPKGGNIPPTPIQVDTEQFLKEIEK